MSRVDDYHSHFLEWNLTRHRGRRRVENAIFDPHRWTRFLAGLPSPEIPVFKPRREDCRVAVSSLPGYCTPRPIPAISSPPKLSSFHRLPLEIRNMIYEYSLHYPTCRDLYDAYYGQLAACQTYNANSIPDKRAQFTVKLFTPTILLLCKDITREALAVLWLRPFVIDRVPPWIMGHDSPLPLTTLISRETLQSLRFVEIKLSLGDSESVSSGEIWLQVLGCVLKAWSASNSLVRLKVVFKVSNLDVTRLWEYEYDIYDDIVATVSPNTSTYLAL